jgi:hypothetical protein
VRSRRTIDPSLETRPASNLVPPMSTARTMSLVTAADRTEGLLAA